MELYFLPAIFAISAKIALFAIGWRAVRFIEKSLLLFLIGLSVVNIIELTLLYLASQGGEAFLFIILYYDAAIISCFTFTYYVLNLNKTLSLKIKRTLIGFCLFVVLCVSVPGLALDSAISIGYSFTRVPGPFYFVVQLALLLCVGVAFVALFKSLWIDDDLIRTRAKVMLLALSPLMLSVMVVLAVMQLGYEVNATVVISIATSFMMAVLVVAESKYRLFQLLSLIPATHEHKQWTRIAEILNNPDLSLKEAQLKFTELFVADAVKRANGSQVKAANILNTSRTTIYRYSVDALPDSDNSD
ncbi:hypothetical protein [Teredinibacter purpureus]|jgi:hypothetical protein|uniref:hypothetical protein n=1 Tax=Teredinibacter purpureus TaxID=2731756 RepID=UPI0005F85503|nr:hypothetical protein [Teredinibacter purpureus]